MMSAALSPNHANHQSAPRLAMRLFGEFAVYYNDQRIVTLDAPRLQALLTYLALQRERVIVRRHLACLLWPDSSEEQALTNLRKHLLHLKQSLPNAEQWLATDRQTIQWATPALVESDVDEFRTLLASSNSANPPDVLDRLRRAIDLYKGELLPGCFDEWLLPLREALHEQYLDALDKLSARLEEQRRYAEAIQTCQQKLRHDPMDESSYRRLLRLQALKGDRAGALRTYHTCVTQLREELGVDPDEETQAVYERLLHGAAGPTAPSEMAASAPFVGRMHEWQILQQRWRMAQRGQPQFVLIAGEAGIGKTRLAEEFLNWATHQGFVTVRARCYAAEGRLTYAPVLDWLRSERLRTQRSRLEANWLSELARLLPEVLNEQPSLPKPEAITQSWQRNHLFAAVTRALLTVDQPLILLLDDLQWCDKETLELLHFFMRNATTIKPAQLMLIGSARLPDEVDAAHPLYALLNPLRSAETLTQIDLVRFSLTETGDLAQQMANSNLDRRSLQQLFADTAGNPLFVVETMRAAQGQITTPASTFPALAASEEIVQHLPPKVLAMIQTRLGQLSPIARQLCEWAAVIGQVFTFDLLVAASQVAQDQAVVALDELWQRRILREQGTDSYDFSHDRIRDVAAAGISRVRRKHLHGRVAEALETFIDNSIDSLAPQIAAQFDAAGAVEQAIHFYRLAADHAAKIYAKEQTVAHLQRAIALLKTLPASQGRDQRELAFLTALAGPLADVSSSAISQMREVHERAYALSQHLAVNLHPSMLRVAAIHKTARRSFVQAEEMGYQLLEIAQQGEATDQVVYLEGCYVVGVTAFWQGHFQQARSYLQQVADVYSAVRTEQHLIEYGQETGIYCRARLAWVLWYLGYPNQARHQCEKSLALAHQLNHPFTLSLALAYSVVFLVTARETSLAEELARSHKVGDQSIQEMFENQFNLVDGWLRLQRGQFAEAIESLNRAEAMRRSISTDSTQYPHILLLLAEAYGQTGAYEQGLAAVEKALSLINYDENFWLIAEMQRIKGELLHQRRKDLTHAEDSLQKALKISHRQAAKSLELRAAMSLARLWAEQGKHDEARELLAGVYHWFTEGFDTADLQEAKALLDRLTSPTPG